MKVDSQILFDIASGNPKITPEIGDAQPSLSQTIFPTIETISKVVIAPASSAIEADNSIVTSSQRNVAASAAAVTSTMVTLTKGCYTITASLAARFVATPAPNGAIDVFIDLTNAAATVNAVLVGLYAQTLTAQSAIARFRLVVTETCLIRARTAATGVGQTIEAMFSVCVERHL